MNNDKVIILKPKRFTAIEFFVMAFFSVLGLICIFKYPFTAVLVFLFQLCRLFFKKLTGKRIYSNLPAQLEISSNGIFVRNTIPEVEEITINWEEIEKFHISGARKPLTKIKLYKFDDIKENCIRIDYQGYKDYELINLLNENLIKYSSSVDANNISFYDKRPLSTKYLIMTKIPTVIMYTLFVIAVLLGLIGVCVKLGNLINSK